MNEGIEVKESPIHGRGVFATKDFHVGETVVTWDISRVISPEQMQLLPEADKEYVAKLDHTLILMQAPAKYVNHSCDPNTRSQNGREVAVKEIKTGDEITTDYRDDSPEGMRMLCQCGSPKCRGLIVV